MRFRLRLIPAPPICVVFVCGLCVVCVVAVVSWNVTFAVVRFVSQSSRSVPTSSRFIPTSVAVSPVGLVCVAFMSPIISTFCIALWLFVYAFELLTSTYQSWIPAW